MSARKYDGWLRWLPMDFLLHQRFESLEKIGGLQIPVLLIHGIKDIKVPHTMTRQLYAAAPEPKRLLLVEKGGHSDCSSPNIGWSQYKLGVTSFIEECLAPAIPAAGVSPNWRASFAPMRRGGTSPQTRVSLIRGARAERDPLSTDASPIAARSTAAPMPTCHPVRISDPNLSVRYPRPRAPYGVYPSTTR